MITDLRRKGTGNRGPGTPSHPLRGAELVVTGSSDLSLKQGHIIHLGQLCQVGRGGHNDITMSNSFASHNHARIIFRDNGFFLEDLNSINGTYINGVRVSEPVPLTHGDTVSIAGVTFKFVRWEYEVE